MDRTDRLLSGVIVLLYTASAALIVFVCVLATLVAWWIVPLSALLVCLFLVLAYVIGGRVGRYL